MISSDPHAAVEDALKTPKRPWHTRKALWSVALVSAILVPSYVTSLFTGATPTAARAEEKEKPKAKAADDGFVKLPSDIKGNKGTFVVVKADTNCPTLRWVLLDSGLSMIPPELLKDSRSAVVQAGTDGVYRILAYGAKGDVPTEPAISVVTIGTGPPPPPPPPDPDKPPTAPVGLKSSPGDGSATLAWLAVSNATSYTVRRAPSLSGPWAEVAKLRLTTLTDSGLTNGTTYYYSVSASNDKGTSPDSETVSVTPQGTQPPAPIPADGYRVLIVYDAKQLSSLPKDQLNAMYSGDVRLFLNANCAAGPDGKTKEWRIWDVNENVSAVPKLWQDAHARAKGAKDFKAPWIIVSNGTTGFEGPLPANTDDLLTLLKKYRPSTTRRKAG